MALLTPTHHRTVCVAGEEEGRWAWPIYPCRTCWLQKHQALLCFYHATSKGEEPLLLLGVGQKVLPCHYHCKWGWSHRGPDDVPRALDCFYFVPGRRGSLFSWRTSRGVGLKILQDLQEIRGICAGSEPRPETSLAPWSFHSMEKKLTDMASNFK